MYVCRLTGSAAILSFSLPSIAVSWWMLLKGRPLSSCNQKYIFDLTVTLISQTGRNDYHRIIFVDIYLLFCLISKKTQKNEFATYYLLHQIFAPQITICKKLFAIITLALRLRRGSGKNRSLMFVCVYLLELKFRLHRNFSGGNTSGQRPKHG